MAKVNPQPTAAAIESAFSEFKRLAALPAESTELIARCYHRGGVLVAERVNLNAWLSSGLAEETTGVVITAFLNDGATAIDEHTTADLVVTKVPRTPHEHAVGEVTGQMREFALHNEELVSAGGGDMQVPGVTRIPDTALCPTTDLGEDPLFGNIPRVVVEVDVHNRTGPVLCTWCQEYLAVPQVRQVVGFKFYPRRVNGTFAAFAVQYGRTLDANGGDAGIRVVDVVSFGTAALNMFDDELSPEARPHLRELPRPTPHDLVMRANPWQPHHNAVLHIPYRDIMYLGPTAHDLIQGAATHPIPDAMHLDLFRVLAVYATFDAQVART